MYVPMPLKCSGSGLLGAVILLVERTAHFCNKAMDFIGMNSTARAKSDPPQPIHKQLSDVLYISCPRAEHHSHSTGELTLNGLLCLQVICWLKGPEVSAHAWHC